jgi:hypothetical protein
VADQLRERDETKPEPLDQYQATWWLNMGLSNLVWQAYNGRKKAGGGQQGVAVVPRGSPKTL